MWLIRLKLVSCPDLIPEETFSVPKYLRREGLEHYLYEDRNFLGAAHRKLIATLTLMINPQSCDDDNKLNFHPLAIQTICSKSQMAKQRCHPVYRISSVIVVT